LVETGVFVGVKVTVKIGMEGLVGVAVGSVRDSKPPLPHASIAESMSTASNRMLT
jgi:hypothetical protein